MLSIIGTYYFDTLIKHCVIGIMTSSAMGDEIITISYLWPGSNTDLRQALRHIISTIFLSSLQA
jgi:hypothetical protein